MEPTTASETATGRLIDVAGTRLWVDQRGAGPDVLLIAGLGDSVEAWNHQLDGPDRLADRYRLTAFDNRGAGRSPLPPDGFDVAAMADDAAAVLAALGVERAHVAGFSGGSATAQELALRHPALVSSLVLVSTWARPDAYFQAMGRSWTWLANGAPDERAALEAFLLWIYSARAHADGFVAAMIDEALAFPHPQTPDGFARQLTAWMEHDTYDRLPQIDVPTLVVAGDEDRCTPPRLGRIVAERIPGAEFVVLAGEAHQPFQEHPDMFNELVDDFWSRVERGPLSGST